MKSDFIKFSVLWIIAYLDIIILNSQIEFKFFMGVNERSLIHKFYFIFLLTDLFPSLYVLDKLSRNVDKQVKEEKYPLQKNNKTNQQHKTASS